MSTPARVYPPVRFVTRMIPDMAQEELRSIKREWVRRSFVYAMLLGMGIDPAKAEVDLDTMMVKHTIP